jgi:pimeloyl-ACP methyl ester carboxylesterase
MIAPHSFALSPTGTRLAYRYVPGDGPTILFLPGYKSDMLGSKAEALDHWARKQGRAFLRLDYSGCGESEGRFEDGTLDVWRDDALGVIEAAGLRDVILVGSSMGGWLMLLLALHLGDQVKALVGIAAAPDFTDWGFSDEEKVEIKARGQLSRSSDYGPEPMITTRAFWQSGQDNLLLGQDILVHCPVRLLQGQCDPDVPWQTALRLSERLCSADVQVTLIKDGDHRLSRAEDVRLLEQTLERLLTS